MKCPLGRYHSHRRTVTLWWFLLRWSVEGGCQKCLHLRSTAKQRKEKKDTSLVTSKWAYTNGVNAGVAVQAALLCMPLTDNTFQNMHLFPSGTMCIWHNIWFYKASWSSSNYHRCERFGELTFQALIRASSALQPFAVGTGFPNLSRL